MYGLVNRNFFQEVKHLATLSREEEELLYPKLVVGCPKAQKVLVSANIRIAIKIANRYHRKYPYLEYDELISEANVGLSIAIKKFNPTMGYRFSTYAQHWIVNSLEKFCVMNNYHVRVTPSVHYATNKVRSWLNERALEVSSVKECHQIDIMEDLSLTKSKLAFIFELINQPKNVNNQHYFEEQASGYDEENNKLAPFDFEVVTTEDDVVERIFDERRKEIVSEARLQLNERENNIISASYGFNDADLMSQEQIAQQMDLTRHQVKAIKRKAIARLKFALKDNQSMSSS